MFKNERLLYELATYVLKFSRRLAGREMTTSSASIRCGSDGDPSDHRYQDLQAPAYWFDLEPGSLVADPPRVKGLNSSAGPRA